MWLIALISITGLCEQVLLAQKILSVFLISIIKLSTSCHKSCTQFQRMTHFLFSLPVLSGSLYMFMLTTNTLPKTEVKVDLIYVDCVCLQCHLSEGLPQVNLMQRMSDMLTRWLDGSMRNRGEGQERGSAPSAEGDNPQQEQEGAGANLPSQQSEATEVSEVSIGGQSEDVTRQQSSSGVQSETVADQRGELQQSDKDERGTLDEGGVEPQPVELAGSCAVQASAVAHSAGCEGVTDLPGSKSAHSSVLMVSNSALKEERFSSEISERDEEHVKEELTALPAANNDSYSADKSDLSAPTQQSQASLSMGDDSAKQTSAASSSVTAGFTVHDGFSSEDPKASAHSQGQHHSVPQTQPQTVRTAQVDSSEAGTPTVTSSSQTSCDVVQGNDSVLDDRGSQPVCSRGETVVCSSLGSGQGRTGGGHHREHGAVTTTTDTCLEPVISLHYSDEGSLLIFDHLACEHSAKYLLNICFCSARNGIVWSDVNL